ncbi:alpha-D-ribose 1-methylphosphonate 5-triphosphate diphosphatase [Roseobacter sp.]|uniref:alpha-D-ribose 1-methylphosphonate 5-triphosphate diphosphatase n=1 Tax=Roseobacter sp. TaxID=1907202 RepID=UPI0025D863BE|nr:alpha-D-ribose 1-methylphosphonate 5-triphosphate diphosphatase [Roseobacter sp.]
MTSDLTALAATANTIVSGAAEQCFANARLVLANRVMTGAVHITGDRIAGITEGDHVPAGAIDCRGDILLPGLVELHTDNLERHMEPRPKVKLPHVPAILAHDGELASVGITTVFDALRVGSMVSDNEHWNRYAREVAGEILGLRARRALRVRHLLHLRAEVCSNTLLEELSEFGPDDLVGLVSLMDHTPGQRQFRDMSKLRTYYSGRYGYSDAEFDALVAARRDLGDRVRIPHEEATVSEAARLGATLASHDDTTCAHVTRSAEMGIRLAEFPTTPEAAAACRDAGIRIIMGAPNLVRGGSHSGNVGAEELAENGLLDIISSDYVPSLLLNSAFRLATLWDDLPRAIATVSATPAEATGLHDRGRIAEGMLADMIRVELMEEVPVIRAVWRGADRIS